MKIEVSCSFCGKKVLRSKRHQLGNRINRQAVTCRSCANKRFNPFYDPARKEAIGILERRQ